MPSIIPIPSNTNLETLSYSKAVDENAEEKNKIEGKKMFHMNNLLVEVCKRIKPLRFCH